MARHQVSAAETSTSEHVRLTGPRDAASPRRDALAQPSPAPRARLDKTWLAAGTVAVVLVLLIIFIAQNTGAPPLAAALLAAALAGALLAATGTMTRGARQRRRGRD